MMGRDADSVNWDIGIICEPPGVTRGFDRVSSTARQQYMRDFSALLLF